MNSVFLDIFIYTNENAWWLRLIAFQKKKCLMIKKIVLE